MEAELDGGGGGVVAGAGVDGDGAVGLLNDGFEGLHALSGAEGYRLTGAAEGGKAVDAVIEQETHKGAGARDAERGIAVEGGDGGSEDSGEFGFLCSIRAHGFLCVAVNFSCVSQ